MRLSAALVACCGIYGAAACNSATSEVGGDYAVSQLVTATSGGTVTVTAAEDPQLAGTQIQIPPGALAADTAITIGVGPAITGVTSAGPIADFGPSGTTFLYPVTITLPYTAGTAIGALTVVGVESDMSGAPSLSIGNADLAIDATTNTLSFKAAGFTRFCAAVGPPPCPPDQTLCGCNGGGVCLDAGSACPAICNLDGGLAGGCCPAGQYLCGCGDGSGQCLPDTTSCLVNCRVSPAGGDGGATVPTPVSVCCGPNQYFCGCGGQGACIDNGQACAQACPVCSPPGRGPCQSDADCCGGAGSDIACVVPLGEQTGFCNSTCCAAGQYYCGCANGSGSCVPDTQSCVADCPDESAGAPPAAACCPSGESFCGCEGVGGCIASGTACPNHCSTCGGPGASCVEDSDCCGGTQCLGAIHGQNGSCTPASDGDAGQTCDPGQSLCNGVCQPNGQPCGDAGTPPACKTGERQCPDGSCVQNDAACPSGDGGVDGGSCSFGQESCGGTCQTVPSCHKGQQPLCQHGAWTCGQLPSDGGVDGGVCSFGEESCGGVCQTVPFCDGKQPVCQDGGLSCDQSSSDGGMDGGVCFFGQESCGGVCQTVPFCGGGQEPICQDGGLSCGQSSSDGGVDGGLCFFGQESCGGVCQTVPFCGGGQPPICQDGGLSCGQPSSDGGVDGGSCSFGQESCGGSCQTIPFCHGGQQPICQNGQLGCPAQDGGVDGGSCTLAQDPSGPCSAHGSCQPGALCVSGDCFGCSNGTCAGCGQ